MRKNISAELKSKVAIEALKGQKTINEIASLYEVQPAQVSAWKKQMQESAILFFSKTKEKSVKESEEIKNNLYRKIGQLEVENEFLKKSGINYNSGSSEARIDKKRISRIKCSSTMYFTGRMS